MPSDPINMTLFWAIFGLTLFVLLVFAGLFKLVELEEQVDWLEQRTAYIRDLLKEHACFTRPGPRKRTGPPRTRRRRLKDRRRRLRNWPEAYAADD